MAKSFPKINAAIEDSFQALQKATNADQNSNDALVRARSVQSQLNAVVRRESDSNAETAQMRVDLNNVEHETANERLAADFEQVEKNLNESAYYQGIDATRHRDAVSQTDYYMLKIPHKDSNGNILKLKRGFGKDVPNGGFTETGRQFAERKQTTVSVNASIFNTSTFKLVGLQISNGKVLNNETVTGRHILGVTDDNTMYTYPPGTSPQTVLNDGCKEALTGFIPLIKNGTRVESSIINSYTSANQPHPRNIICQYPNKDLLIFACDGRTTNNPGMTVDDAIRLLLPEGVQFAYMLDGGGSTQLVYKGTMLNRAVDSNGYAEREVPDFLYIAKEVKYNRDKDIVSVNADIGELSKKVADVLLDVYNKTDINAGFMRLMGPEGYTSHGIDVYEGTKRLAKLYLFKDGLQYYDTLNSKNLFRVLSDGTIQTQKGDIGEFLTNGPVVTNANSIDRNGFYWTYTTATGTPDNTFDWAIFHIQQDTNKALQIAYPFTQANIRKKRRKTNGSWEAWVDA
ncbi:MAG: phosphodiester glycosidase family protein, partial [Ruminococcus sp.]